MSLTVTAQEYQIKGRIRFRSNTNQVGLHSQPPSFSSQHRDQSTSASNLTTSASGASNWSFIRKERIDAGRSIEPRSMAPISWHSSLGRCLDGKSAGFAGGEPFPSKQKKESECQ